MDSISHRRFLEATAAGAGSLAVVGGAPTTEIGKGKIDWKAVFVEAKKIKIAHYFVEQEPPFSEMPPMQAIKISYDYLHSLNV